MLIKLGNWFFHFRNVLFPVFYAALFIPSTVIFQNEVWAFRAGSLFIGMGIFIRCVTIGLVYIIRGGSKRQIHAEILVTDGIYKVCRNPMYLGNILLIFGFGLFANSLIFLLIFFPLFVFFYFTIIKAEEDFLLKIFGKQFLDYKASTNSLIPSLENLDAAFEGLTFKWKEVLFKEYNSLMLYFSGISLLLLSHGHIGIGLFGIIETIMLILYILVKLLKYNILQKKV